MVNRFCTSFFVGIKITKIGRFLWNPAKPILHLNPRTLAIIRRRTTFQSCVERAFLRDACSFEFITQEQLKSTREKLSVFLPDILVFWRTTNFKSICWLAKHTFSNLVIPHTRGIMYRQLKSSSWGYTKQFTEIEYKIMTSNNGTIARNVLFFLSSTCINFPKNQINLLQRN
jgi:hypothetical protein